MVSTRTCEANSEVSIAVLSGRLGIEAEETVGEPLRAVIDGSTAGTVLDMSDVEFVSSTGLRALMLAYRHAKSQNKSIAMFRVRTGVAKVFKLTGFANAFHILSTEAEAVELVAK